MRGMTDTENDLLSDVEKALREKFGTEGSYLRVQSTAQDVAPSERVGQLVVPKGERGPMPFTKDKYIVREDPQLVAWERVTREFLRELGLATGHRISAVMIFEWATQLSVKDLKDAGEPPNSELRKLNKILRFYFGKSYTTYIMNKKVANCYRVREGYRIKRHRPMTMELLAEYYEGTLNP
jgi:hypothetical protein